MEEYEIVKIICDKLKISELCTEQEQILFEQKIGTYLNHSRTGNNLGRTKDTVIHQLENLIIILKLMDFDDLEIINFLNKDISIINLQGIVLIEKYILFNLLELSDEMKKEKMIANPKNLRISNEIILKRFFFALNNEFPLNKLTYSMLFKNTNEEYFSIFTKTRYKKKYKKYNFEDLDLLIFDFNHTIIPDNYIYYLIPKNSNNKIEIEYLKIYNHSVEERGRQC